MADEARLLLETLSELRVVDLKRELEKRKLSKSGSKKELCERLRTHLKIEELRGKNVGQGSDPIASLNLPAGEGGMETNEFVKSYLEQREKLLERQMEQKKKYQEEAYKSQESESQSEAEDLSQHQSRNVSETSQHVEQLTQQTGDVENKPQAIKMPGQTRPEYNSDTDEDTEEEGDSYSQDASAVTFNQDDTGDKTDNDDATPASTVAEVRNDGEAEVGNNVCPPTGGDGDKLGGDKECHSMAGEKDDGDCIKNDDDKVESNVENLNDSNKTEDNIVDEVVYQQIVRPDDDDSNSTDVVVDSANIADIEDTSVANIKKNNTNVDNNVAETCADEPKAVDSECTKDVSEEGNDDGEKDEAAEENTKEAETTNTDKTSDDDMAIKGDDSHNESAIKGDDSHNESAIKGDDSHNESAIKGDDSHNESAIKGDDSHNESAIKGDDSHNESAIKGDDSHSDAAIKDDNDDDGKVKKIGDDNDDGKVQKTGDDDDDTKDVTTVVERNETDSSVRPAALASEEPLEVMVQKEDEFDEVKVAHEETGNGKDVAGKSPTTEKTTSPEKQPPKNLDPEIKVFTRKLFRLSHREEDKVEPSPAPARKRKWGSVGINPAAPVISSDSLKVLVPEVMIDLSVPCEEMMDIIGSDEPEQDARSKITRSRSTDQSRQEESKKSKPTSAPAVKLARTIYQDVDQTNASDAMASTSTVMVSTGNERVVEKKRERKVVERKSSTKEIEIPERNVVIGGKLDVATSETDQSVATADAGMENSSKRRRVNPPLQQSVDDPLPVEGGKRALTPPRNPTSKFIHVFNLVRPYTLNQLKEILSRTGTLVETGFWIDKIKSHCIVEYETSDEAAATRETLHGKKWPAWNPKILRVDFSSEEELNTMRNAKDGVLPIPTRHQRQDRSVKDTATAAAAAAVIAATTAASADVAKVLETGKKHEESQKAQSDSRRSPDRLREREGRRRRDNDRERERVAPQRREDEHQHPIREWDRNKVRASLETGGERSPNRRRRRQSDRDRDVEEESDAKRPRMEKENETSSKNAQKEEPPAKLLDDLFRKTKATPCIYWLPLTEEQIVEKEKQVKTIEVERMQRRAEREKKLEEERDDRIKARAVAQRDREVNKKRDF